ncbi:MAG: ATP-binding cassette domain-containing protein [candidate division Zixibacteria bacterium]|nr:ATP-binding cassette domain-containing protein [candidate division Zixibacteria bacterium]
MIKTFELTKQYGEKTALDNLNLEIGKGELFGFLGPNGAGKTTTIKLIMGMLKPTSGRVEVAGFDMAKDAINAKRLLGYVPDSPYVYEKLTGREYLEFIASVFEMTAKETRYEIDKYTSLLGMSEYLDYRTGEYSHGMRQKVVLAAAFIHNPELLVIDEPMVGLDPSSARIVKDIFVDFADKGSTVFVSTHTLPLAEEICHRIGIINQGNLIAVGTKDDLRSIAAEAEGNLEKLFLKLTGKRENYAPALNIDDAV